MPVDRIEGLEGPAKNVLTQEGRRGQSSLDKYCLVKSKRTQMGNMGTALFYFFNMCLKSLQVVKSYGTSVVAELSLLSLGHHWIASWM